MIGTAVSDDLERWEVMPPMTRPGQFGHMEIPQLVEFDGRWVLLFSTPGRPEPSPELGAAVTLTGTHYLVADDPLGPFGWDHHGVLLGDGRGTWYGAKLVAEPGGGLVCLAWRTLAADGSFAGELSDPMPIGWSEGALVVNEEG